MYEFLDNRLVSSDHVNIAEIIADYDPDLELCWIPPDARVHGEDPWAVFHTKDGHRYLVKTFTECDHRILAYLFQNDTARNDVLARLEAEEAAKQAIELKRQIEESEQRQDMVATALKSPLHTYRIF
jgi:hypothetical protein